MKAFMDKDFLLSTETAKKLYHEYAEVMPIIDYHCHINPQEIYEDRKFDNITQVWLGGDHYKWRQLRAFGVSEELITGKSVTDVAFECGFGSTAYFISIFKARYGTTPGKYAGKNR